jgi:opacity protein-like surface antigen
MNRRIISATIGFCGLAFGMMPALAGDWNNGAGSLKDRGNAAVPVPAPATSYDGPSGWYMRLDVGLGRESNRGSKESGLVYGSNPGSWASSPTGTGFGSSASWFNDASDLTVNYSGGVGYRWNSNWRSDVTLEHRSATDYKMRGSYRYDYHQFNAGPPVTYTAVPNLVVNGVTSDDTNMKSGVLMASTYYDWKNRTAFTPYVGAGLGVAYVTLHRDHASAEQLCDTLIDPTCSTAGVARTWSASGAETHLLWAGAMTAGFSYAFTPVTSLDVNYRMLYIPTSNVHASVQGHNSQFSYNDIFEHQIRAGLRWDIN